MNKLINAFNPTIKTAQQKYQTTKSVTFSLNRRERFTKESIFFFGGGGRGILVETMEH